MIADVHEPLELYSTFFRDAHARNTSEFFEDLVRQSGVDEHANIITVKELRQLEKQVAEERLPNTWWRRLRGVVICVFLICLIYVFTHYAWLWLIGPVLVFVPALYKLNHVIDDVSERLKRLEQQRDDKCEEAWQQMASLNGLYDWDMVAKLVQQTVPRIAFDAYFSNGRLEDLCNTYGWDGQFNDGRSIVFAHTGALNGNPFVLARTLDHWMGAKTYHGSLDIRWTVDVHDADKDEWTTETRYETLHASIEKPFPEFGNRTFIIYGNEAAPDLSFSRRSSELSELKDGLLNNWKKQRAIKKLEVKSRDLEEGQRFTVMANREFDALFGATDRDHEVQFRLLFTPLAQQEMLKLLKDKGIGYGDNFEFTKQRMLNFIEPCHMKATHVEAPPSSFHAYELAHARKFFNDYHNDFFRSFFFGIAPLLAIPFYQQHRSHADIYKDVYAKQSCFWEHESIANYMGEQAFQHAECVTNSILKTVSSTAADGTQTVTVAAHGYKSEDRVTYVSVSGGDGQSHQVPVHWTEYLEVQRNSKMVLQEKGPLIREEDTALTDTKEGVMQKFKQRGVEFQNIIFRRSIVSAVLPG